MSIKGFFPTGYHSLPAPHVQAAVLLPRLKLHALISFMLDTGADNTTLSLIDTERLNVSYRRLKRSSLESVTGFGAEQYCYIEEAVIVMREEDSTTCLFPINVYIPRKGKKRIQREQQRRLPSVLGRDILNRCRLEVDFQQGIAELTPPEGAKLPVAMRKLL